jgi:hypothetical protein
MSKQLKLSDYDFVFLSYDEPNADENYENLQKQVPWAKRVHGVKGSDAAHKTCANLSETDRLVIVDGDNFVYGDLLYQTLEVTDDIALSNTVFSWPSYNVINGLIYGNGGIKFWPKDAILNMQTHEASDPTDLKSQVDFCWTMNYVGIDHCFSETRNNATPHQAWRAGFREGVKMSLNDGARVSTISEIYSGNLNRLLIWMTVGLDSTNGIWAILGARQGCHLTNFSNWDYTQVRDFDFLNSFWEQKVSMLNKNEVLKEIEELGRNLSNGISVIMPFNEDQSHFFKQLNFNPLRQPTSIKVHFNL